MHWLGCSIWLRPRTGRAAHRAAPFALGRRPVARRRARRVCPPRMHPESERETGACCARACPRAMRYQVARFCQWEGKKKAKAKRVPLPGHPQARWNAPESPGPAPIQLTGLLRRYSEGPLPPRLVQALDRWEGRARRQWWSGLSCCASLPPKSDGAAQNTRRALPGRSAQRNRRAGAPRHGRSGAERAGGVGLPGRGKGFQQEV
jgi:hypothetical protein